MDDPRLLVAVSVGATLLALGILMFLLAAGDAARLASAWSVLRGGAAPQRHEIAVESKPSAPSQPTGAPVRFLGLLQREGRLLDFLLEDINAYQDAQIGAAVRDIHRQCQAALKEHLVLEPVLSQNEGDTIHVEPGFDPAAIRLTGNVTGKPPFTGTLQHHGWRVKEIKLGAPPEGQDEFILMPAEVELT